MAAKEQRVRVVPHRDVERHAACEAEIASLARRADAMQAILARAGSLGVAGDDAGTASSDDLVDSTQSSAALGVNGMEPLLSEPGAQRGDPSLIPVLGGTDAGPFGASSDGVASLLSVQEQSLDLLRRIAENTGSAIGVVS